VLVLLATGAIVRVVCSMGRGMGEGETVRVIWPVGTGRKDGDCPVEREAEEGRRTLEQGAVGMGIVEL